MADLITRASTADIEVVRGGDGRTVHGILVPWDTPARVFDAHGPNGVPEQYDEAIARGAFPDALTAPQRVKFLSHHDKRANPLGRAAALRDDAAGLYGELRVSKTQAGDEALELIRDGALDAFSVGFVPLESELHRGTYVRTRASLSETSIVTFGAYSGAQVLGVRSDLPNEAPAEGAGESSRVDGSGEPDESAARTGMTPNERDRAIAISQLS